MIATRNALPERAVALWRVVVLLLSCFVVFLLLVTCLAILRDSKPPTALLPDGSEVQFLGVRVGGVEFSTEKPWEKLSRRYLPARMTTWIRPSVTGSCGAGTNTLTVYVQ